DRTVKVWDRNRLPSGTATPDAGQPEIVAYTNAVIQRLEDGRVVLMTDGKEVTLALNPNVTYLDTKGTKVHGEAILKGCRPTNLVDVKALKNGGGTALLEMKLVKGDLPAPPLELPKDGVLQGVVVGSRVDQGTHKFYFKSGDREVPLARDINSKAVDPEGK